MKTKLQKITHAQAIGTVMDASPRCALLHRLMLASRGRSASTERQREHAGARLLENSQDIVQCIKLTVTGYATWRSGDSIQMDDQQCYISWRNG
jgi:hypothetical protein